VKPYTEGEIQSFNRSLEDGIEPQRGGIDPYDLSRWLVTVDRLSARVAKLEAALRFYAGRLTYAAHYSYSGGPTYAILDDGGDTARAALEPTQSGSERSDEEDKS
jgi:hypothetical protein